MAEQNVNNEGANGSEKLTLVVRKPYFGLPTACPICLPAYIYLKFANVRFDVDFNLVYPDSDQIPFAEYGSYVAYNNEKGGVIQCLKNDGIVDLDSNVSLIPDWVSTKAMVESWLAEAVMYELWVDPDGSSAHKIYFSDLPWPIGKLLYLKKVYKVKQLLGISKENCERRKEEIYTRAATAYRALSTKLGEQSFFFEDRPTSLDAEFLGHVLFTLYALPETSSLRSKLLEHANLVNYAESHKLGFIDAAPQSQSDPSSSAPKRGPSSFSKLPFT
ncbi:OLC1v1035923C2 [Oldenlandia corymbosa var. corymbosa]|uniref:OLC1v1035923C2 n=1 Tax=Oldenlandia corymbosa var. corymbosa TaxID=529605 RepID=A0AAV1CU68_OLDCO|nr:OLC1v1035923C2 [Oldenlandia corymbosa var. corymbosa]